MRINQKFISILILMCAILSACICLASCAEETPEDTTDITNESNNAADEVTDTTGESETVPEETSTPETEAAVEVISEFGCPELPLEELFYYKFSDPNNPDMPFRMQGGCFDGTNFYFAFISHSVPEELAYIVVLDKEGNEIKRSGVLETGHSNSLSLYKDGTILVSVGNSTDYYIVDKEELTVIEKKSDTLSFLSIDYCAETDEYVMLHSGYGKVIQHRDSSFTMLKRYKIEIETDTSGQNFFCTPDFLYSPRYKHLDGRFHNFLHINTWTAKLKALYYLNIRGDLEAQSVIADGNTVYIPCGNTSAECFVYMAEVDTAELR